VSFFAACATDSVRFALHGGDPFVGESALSYLPL
jgi:hypothetical protein